MYLDFLASGNTDDVQIIAQDSLDTEAFEWKRVDFPSLRPAVSRKQVHVLATSLEEIIRGVPLSGILQDISTDELEDLYSRLVENVERGVLEASNTMKAEDLTDARFKLLLEGPADTELKRLERALFVIDVTVNEIIRQVQVDVGFNLTLKVSVECTERAILLERVFHAFRQTMLHISAARTRKLEARVRDYTTMCRSQEEKIQQLRKSHHVHF